LDAAHRIVVQCIANTFGEKGLPTGMKHRIRFPVEF
jgi:hypothetical protein